MTDVFGALSRHWNLIMIFGLAALLVQPESRSNDWECAEVVAKAPLHDYFDKQKDPQPLEELAATAQKLTNRDVDWTLDQFGDMTPIIDQDPLMKLVAAGDKAIPVLLKALESPDRFVAAHVALSVICGRQRCAFSRIDDGYEVNHDTLVVMIRFRRQQGIVVKEIEYPDADTQRNFLTVLWEATVDFRAKEKAWKERQPKRDSFPTSERADSGGKISAAEINQASAAVRSVKDADIEWRYTGFHLYPVLPKSAQDAISKAGMQLIPDLQSALDDPHRTIAAHVMLTFVTESPNIVFRQVDDHVRVFYNNLTVKLLPAKTIHAPCVVEYPQAKIERYWLRYMWRTRAGWRGLSRESDVTPK